MKNLFQNVSEALPDEVIETLLETETVRIERIVSDGHASPPGFWYDQPEHEVGRDPLWIRSVTV
ncbi:cupin domain-containing protein [Thalassoglobus polymorphus]|uniref:hypothetical protein n=1 Tax=Thalassoglobus polymorphus TaxID=2527994 RepID=UPI001E3C9BC2|nr:hypothetical protein [Thalassoglobus polymorphus]